MKPKLFSNNSEQNNILIKKLAPAGLYQRNWAERAIQSFNFFSLQVYAQLIQIYL